MGRRLVSVMMPGENGPRVGGSGTELRIFTDAGLTTLASLYDAQAGGATLPNPPTPATPFQTTLAVAVAINDVTIDVQDVSGFAVGNVVAIYDGVNTDNVFITAINSGLKRLTVKRQNDGLGVQHAYTTALTLVGAADLIGFVSFWIDTVQDYYGQVKNIASGRVLPPLVFPVQVPSSAIAFQDEGVSTGSTRQTLNFIGMAVSAVDDAGNARVNVTINDRSYLSGAL